MAQTMCTADKPPCETFRKFFECWLREQNSYLQELVSAANNHNENNNDEEEVLIPLIKKVVRHYELYYQTKSKWERLDTMSMFSPAWRSKLEGAFLWIGGWRPTLAIHLLYSKSGIQLEAKMGDLILGLTTKREYEQDLAELGSSQMEQIDALQIKTIHEERVLTEKLAKQQESVADRSMVELSNAVSEMIRDDIIADDEKVESTLEPKQEGMEELLHMADGLRLETLKAVISILTPIQAVHFLIAAAELHLRLHEWGKKRDIKAVSAGGTHNLATGLHVA